MLVPGGGAKAASLAAIAAAASLLLLTLSSDIPGATIGGGGGIVGVVANGFSGSDEGSLSAVNTGGGIGEVGTADNCWRP